MKKGSAQISMLVGLLIFIGLAFVFFAGAGSEKSSSTQLAQSASPKTDTTKSRIGDKLNSQFQENLQEFKNTISNLQEKEQKAFREETNKAFNQLSTLIKRVGEKASEEKMSQGEQTGGAAEMQREQKEQQKMEQSEMEQTGGAAGISSEIQDRLNQVEESAQRIATVENKDELINEIKKAFRSSKEALKTATDDYKSAMSFRQKTQQQKQKRDKQNKQQEGDLIGKGLFKQENKHADQAVCRCIDENFDRIERKIDKIDTGNYQRMTQEIFMHFHSILNCVSQHTCKIDEYSALSMTNAANTLATQNEFVNVADKAQKTKAFKKDLQMFKKQVNQLETQNVDEFKKQTQNTFMDLAELLKAQPYTTKKEDAEQGYPYISKKRADNIEKKIDDIKTKARKIPQLTDKEDLVDQIKDTFRSSYVAAKELLEAHEKSIKEKEIIGQQNLKMQQQAKQEKMSIECADDKLDQLEKQLRVFDTENFMQKTQDSFMLIHSSLNCLY